MFEWIDESEWLEQRKRGIGGSEASMVMGVNPWKSKLELWNEKVTRMAHIDATKQLMFKVGRTLEPIIADEYSQKTGRILQERPLKIHPYYPFILGNIDREIVDALDGRGPGILEIKTKGAQTQWHQEDIPIYYRIQLQHYLEIYKYKWGSFAVLDLGRMELSITDIERDDNIINLLIKEEISFWELVKKKIPPDVDNTISCQEFLREKFKTGKAITIDLHENDDANRWVPLLKEAKDAIKKFGDIEIEAKNHLMSIMGDAEKGVGKDYVVSWKAPKDKEIFEVERFKLDYPELAKKYIKKESQSRRFMVRFTERKKQKQLMLTDDIKTIKEN